MNKVENGFHLHLISDATGETLLTVARAAAARYPAVRPIEHVYPLVRSEKHIMRIFREIQNLPGIVLYTLVNPQLGEYVETISHDYGIPCVSILEPVLSTFRAHLGAPVTTEIGAQHALDDDYFRRIDALNFTMMHDDGVLPQNLEDADLIIIGISRTSKTPTSIYLANRGIKTTNIPIIPEIPLPEKLFSVKRPLVVALIATPERIALIRQNRLLALNAADSESAYVNRNSIASEIAFTRKLCDDHGWPIIDVTRRSIEETAAAIYALYQEHRANLH